MINSTYDPQNRSAYEKSKMMVSNKGLISVCNLNSTTNIDLTLTDDMLFVGMQFGCINQTWGDSVDLQILSPLLAVVLQPVTSWYVATDTQIQASEEAIFPAKIPAGFTIRLVYNSTATTGPQVNIFANFKLHKILV
jgi:hypothetical protein